MKLQWGEKYLEFKNYHNEKKNGTALQKTRKTKIRTGEEK